MKGDSLIGTSRRAWDIARAAGLLRSRVGAVLLSYYVLTPISATADGVSWILLFRVFSADSAMSALDSGGMLSNAIARYCPTDPQAMLRLVLALFVFRAFSTVALTSIEGWLQALFRRSVQEHCFKVILTGRWDALRGQSVGSWVGALTEETSTLSKYLMYFVKGLFSLVSFLILGGMAFLVAPKTTLLCAAVAVPAWLVLRMLYDRQSKLSTLWAQARQDFSGDITERMTGLYQIKAAGETAAYLESGLRRQEGMTRQEITLAYYNGVLTAFNPMLLAAGLAVFYFRSKAGGASLSLQLSTLGSVGVLGFRAASQLNTLVATLGNMTRLSGCVDPVGRMASIPGEKPKLPLPAPLKSVRLRGVGYSVGDKRILSGVDATIEPGRMFLISGPSGAGKTTLANIVSGLYEPTEGALEYAATDGKTYAAAEYKARIGYVTQDVHLFKGPLRHNLDPFGMIDDASLWKAVEDAGAKPFVERLGGLDAPVAEAGRSLSGGEKRRLAMARALAQRTDCLILDEVTNGLDDRTKGELLATIAYLSRARLVVSISHDLAAFQKIDHVSLVVAPARGQEKDPA